MTRAAGLAFNIIILDTSKPTDRIDRAGLATHDACGHEIEATEEILSQ